MDPRIENMLATQWESAVVEIEQLRAQNAALAAEVERLGTQSPLAKATGVNDLQTAMNYLEAACAENLTDETPEQLAMRVKMARDAVARLVDAVRATSTPATLEPEPAAGPVRTGKQRSSPADEGT